MLATEEIEDLNKIISETKIKKSEENQNTLESENEDFPYSLSLRIKELEDEKDLKKFVKSTEALIRRSPEYKLWTSYVRDVLGCSKCEITDERIGEVTVEIHHHPFSLYTIVKAEVLKNSSNNKEFCSFDIATNLIEQHFQNQIGYIPLVKTIHEKFHNGYFQIPLELIHGDYKNLITKYFDYLDDEEKDLINARLAVNKENCGWSKGLKWAVKEKSGD
jgi:hypothetical protein